jgi:hypothetical protein
MAVGVLHCACEAPDAQLAVPDSPATIVGGVETNYESWQSVVALVTLMNGRPAGICTGSLIHPEVVLTAGHCVRLAGGFLSPSYDHTKNPGNLVVKIGASVGPMGGKGDELSNVAEAVHHPTWNGDINAAVAKGGFDLALVHLSTPATDMGTYCLREGDQPLKDEKGIIVGYGLLGSSQTMSAGKHRFGDTSVRAVTSSTIEIGNPTATCQGDSGGPLFTLVEDRWEITGVTSYGGPTCLPNQGAFSANVVSQFDWINEQVEKWTGDSLNNCTLCGATERCEPELPTEDPVDTEIGEGEGEGEGEGTEEGEDSEGGEGEGKDEGAKAEGDTPAGCGCSAVGASQTVPLFSLLSVLAELL